LLYLKGYGYVRPDFVVLNKKTHYCRARARRMFTNIVKCVAFVYCKLYNFKLQV